MGRYLVNGKAILAALMLLGGMVGIAQAEPKDCLSCHEDEPTTQNMLHGVHGQFAAGQGQSSCQSCHGESLAHRDEPRENPVDLMFNQLTEATLQNESCQGCHNGGEHKGWDASAHAMADVSCASCHTVHERKDRVLDNASQPEVCSTCHQDQTLNHLKFSRHPISEGVMGCASCHDTHGGKGPSMLVEATVNETCFTCHAEKRGPMLFEHEPVQDNCLNCHTPHGSVNDNMLATRSPLLCQQCHIDTSHRGTNYVNESNVTGMNNRLIGKSCANCHTQVHGTNHPAGASFRR